MQQVTFKITLTEEEKQLKQKEVKQLEENKQLLDWMNTNNIPFTCIQENTYTLKEYWERKEKCIHCLGLQQCAQTNKGYLLELEYKGYLQQVSCACKYAKEKQRNFMHQKKYLLCDMSEDQLLLDISKINLNVEGKSYQKLVIECLEGCQHGFSKGLFLCGKPGCGKTYLACCIANAFAKKGYTVSFVNVAKFMDDLKRSLNDSQSYKRLILSLRNADVLILDDIASENVSNWGRDEILFSILNERMENKRLTFFTSNYAMENLLMYYKLPKGSVNEDVGAIRLIERMKALSTQKVLDCANRRIN